MNEAGPLSKGPKPTILLLTGRWKTCDMEGSVFVGYSSEIQALGNRHGGRRRNWRELIAVRDGYKPEEGAGDAAL